MGLDCHRHTLTALPVGTCPDVPLSGAATNRWVLYRVSVWWSRTRGVAVEPRAHAAVPAGVAPRAGAAARPFAAAAVAREVAAPGPAARRGTGPGAPSGGTEIAVLLTSQCWARIPLWRATETLKSLLFTAPETTQLGQPLITAGGNDKRASALNSDLEGEIQGSQCQCMSSKNELKIVLSFMFFHYEL